MLAIFHKTVAHPPQELGCSESTSTVPPMPGYSQRQPKNPDEILRDFHSAHPVHAFCATFSGGAALACLGPRAPPPSLLHRRCALLSIRIVEEEYVLVYTLSLTSSVRLQVVL